MTEQSKDLIWRDINTAPETETRALIYGSFPEVMTATIARYKDGRVMGRYDELRAGCSDFARDGVTHWMPFPRKPESSR